MVYKDIISEKKALKIVDEFILELIAVDEKNLLAVYVIGSLGGGYIELGRVILIQLS